MSRGAALGRRYRILLIAKVTKMSLSMKRLCTEGVCVGESVE